MLNSLNKLFKNIELSWIDSVADIDSSDEFFDLISIFPNLERIFQDAREKNRDEIQRTIRHIFRSYKIFFLIKSGKFSHETLSQGSINKIREKVLNQHFQNQLIIPIILMYHDIGRYIDNKRHPYHSYNLVSSMKLLEPFGLSDIEKLLIRKIVHYHLLIATIYTGESTYYGVYSIFNDPEFIKLFSHEKIINSFIDLLEVFTYIDILGYYYTKIFDHYIKYYDEISSKLKIILGIWPDKELALKKSKLYSQEWLEWRLAGALRIFQFVETKPYLTKEFYYNKLKESIKESGNQILSEINWDSIKNQFLIHSYKIQMRYSLALLMILAFGSFQRMGLKINTGVSYKLILFWTLLSKEIDSRSKNNPNSLWNVFLEGMPHWSKINNSFIEKMNKDNIEFIIHNANHEYDEIKEEFTLYLNFNQIVN
ncbi:MAG: hypothetical protein HWN81_04180 [Candidatus Lokiarchaeota archaeon]|nr:hypothetical protein [Candidatus Lokiarchaeota archaeon]